ncbi:DUF4192 domain-containing protein [Isoptericola sp. NEAU-Y5]|uniref:DUF4192 domain-containing protein n=1 Tax=Isoptericola luteus TaxID=2879484 RepID=A0ABS7ZFS5_9MICO|nr:DUF4192 family protein [Isoptericola sp. NEAU-Y5]MCA5893873.1 DUF4192 domain-containing protein [Isoptericola sp. NEAU-Y5]
MHPTVVAQFPDPHDPGPGAPPGGVEPAVRVRTTRDLVAAVPALLGYRPQESLTVVCVTGAGTVGLVARVGLDDLAAERAASAGSHPPAALGVRDRLVPAVRGVGTVTLVAVVHSARDRRAVRRVVAPVLDGLDAVCDVDPWHVAPTGYRGLDCEDPSCCPPDGHPTAGLEHGAVNAALVVAGRTVAPSWEEAHRIVRAPEALRSRAARAASRAARAAADRREDAGGGTGTDAVHGPPGSRESRRRTAGLDLWHDLLRHAAVALRAEPGGTPELGPARLGRLAAALADVAVRDAVLLSLIPGADDVARRTAARRPASPVGVARDESAGAGGAESGDVEVATARAIARVVDPRVAVAPDPGTAAAARAVLEQVVAHVPRRWHAPPLTLLGVLAWWQGDGGLAMRRTSAAIEADAQHRLAVLLRGVLAAAVPPGWVRARGVG